MSTSPKMRRGFTLIELLLVIGIIAILASIVIVAINPTRQLGQARDTSRRSDVNAILNAVYQYSIEHNGALPPGIVLTEKEICATGAIDDFPTACAVDGSGEKVNLDLLTQTGSYLVSIPSDPQATGSGTNYWISSDANDRITVEAKGAEQTPDISVTR